MFVSMLVLFQGTLLSVKILLQQILTVIVNCDLIPLLFVILHCMDTFDALSMTPHCVS